MNLFFLYTPTFLPGTVQVKDLIHPFISEVGIKNDVEQSPIWQVDWRWRPLLFDMDID